MDRYVSSLKSEMAEGRVPRGAVPIPGLGPYVVLTVYKATKFPCECLKDTKAYRLVFAVNPERFILLIEIYPKNQHVNHDMNAIRKAVKPISPHIPTLSDPYLEILSERCRNLYINDC
ncbi:MAG: hypothetical protein LBS92_03115 [Candidatus Methanoplasma sp.]|nr:hypothetical protein [Candidatus Methanoplasma sp.]